MKKVYIAGALRTPLGTYRGSLADLSEQKLAALAMRGLIERTGIAPEVIDEMIIGNSRQTSTPSNLARHAQLEAELPVEIPAYTVQRQSASGLQAIANGYLAIRSGCAEVILAGGAESMSQIPLEIRNARYAFGADTEIIFDPIANQLAGAQPEETYGRLTAGAIAESIAQTWGITAAEAEAYRVAAGEKRKDRQTGLSVLPIEVKRKKTVETVASDQCYESVEGIARPADGAAVCLLCSAEAVEKEQLLVVGELLGFAFEADSPRCAGIFGENVVVQVLEKARLGLDDMDFFEITEFSAIQMAAAKKVLQNMGMTKGDLAEKVNSTGGALTTGLSWAACGAVMLTDLIDKLRKERKKYGMVITPAEGGQVLAAVVKVEQR